METEGSCLTVSDEGVTLSLLSQAFRDFLSGSITCKCLPKVSWQRWSHRVGDYSVNRGTAHPTIPCYPCMCNTVTVMSPAISTGASASDTACKTPVLVMESAHPWDQRDTSGESERQGSEEQKGLSARRHNTLQNGLDFSISGNTLQKTLDLNRWVLVCILGP